MMAGTVPRLDGEALASRLPPVAGRITIHAPLDRITWFRVGGPAEVMFKPADRVDLAAFLAGCPADIPITVLGVASNMLIRDGGIPGVVIRLGRELAGIETVGDQVRTGAGALDANVAKVAQRAGLAGLEFFAGIPGTIGGALFMNGGAYGGETKSVLVRATGIDRQGRTREFDPVTLGMRYRHTDTPEGFVFVEALFQAHPGDPDTIAARMAEITSARGSTQPIRSQTGGSTFANPEGHKAWQLIDAAGCRGLKVGRAMVSEQHCNFLINTGGATAAELEELGEAVRARVMDTTGVELRWEIRRLGLPLPVGEVPS